MKVLILNQDWFAEEMRELGHEVVTAGLSVHSEVQLVRPVLPLSSVLALLPNGFTPDVILARQQCATSHNWIYESSIPIALYSVDNSTTMRTCTRTLLTW